MAIDEEEKVVPKEKKDNSGLIMIVVVALVVVSMAISAVSLLQVISLNKAISTLSETTPEEVAADEEESTQISVMDIQTFDFSEKFIFIYNDEVDPDSVHNVVVEISVGVYYPEKPSKAEKDIPELADSALLTLATKETIIRSGLESMMKTKSFSDFQTPESLDMLKADILKYLQERLLNETIIDVYFNNMLTSSN